MHNTSSENPAWTVARQIKEITVAIGNALKDISGSPVKFALVCWGDRFRDGTVLGTNAVDETEAVNVLSDLVDTMQLKLALEDDKDVPTLTPLSGVSARH